MLATDHAATWTAIEALNQAFTSSNESADLRGLRLGRDEWPRWYHQLLNQVLALAGGCPIEYVTSSVRDPRIEGDDVYAFTANLVIHAQVSGLTEGTRGQDATVRTTAWSRSSLTELTVINLSPFPVDDGVSDVEFPRNLSLELHYEQRSTLRLPLPSFTNSHALQSIYPSLLADLTQEREQPQSP